MDKLDRLIEMLCAERGEQVHKLSENEKRRLFRALVNVRMPNAASEEFLRVQDEYLREELRLKGVTDIAELPAAPGRPRPLSLAGRYYNAQMRRDSKRRQLGIARLFLPQSRLYRQRDTHLCGRAA